MSDANVAVVTGAAQGLGAVIATRLHARGLRVVLADQARPERRIGLQQALDPSGATARAFTLDVREAGRSGRSSPRSTAEWGDLHVVVNNAARTRSTPLMQITAEEFDAVIGVNLTGTFTACQVLGARMAERGYGRIVNIGSLAGQNGGTATGAHYAASKGGDPHPHQGVRPEFAARGVTVNAMAPGPLDLPVVHSVVPPDRMPSYLSTIPVGRLGAPEFVAQVVELLASREAAFVTGACWDVNGGLYLR